jgi:hypothetical protein
MGRELERAKGERHQIHYFPETQCRNPANPASVTAASHHNANLLKSSIEQIVCCGAWTQAPLEVLQRNTKLGLGMASVVRGGKGGLLVGIARGVGEMREKENGAR